MAKYGIDEGDFFYLDLKHYGDHVEVFHGFKHSAKELWRTAKTVINSDGTKNLGKTITALGKKFVNNQLVNDPKHKLREIYAYIAG